MFRHALIAVALLGLLCCGPSACDSGGGASNDGPRLAVIAKSTVNAYWKAVEAGAKDAADELGAQIIWTGPDAETNHTQQANMVDNMVNRQVDGIVLAPTNVEALVRPVESATARGVPVVLIDSTLNSDEPISVVATDNYAAGRQAAEALIDAIGDERPHGGKVVMLRFLEGSGSTEAREQGFIDRIEEEEGLSVVESVYTKGSGSTTDAADTADALLRRFTEDDRLRVDGVFASNQPTAIGMLRKLEQFRASGVDVAVPYVGFDAHEVLLAGIRDGKIDALVVQDPKRMGYLGVATMVRHLNGEGVEPNIATATLTVTPDNIDEPGVKQVTLEE